LDHNNFNLRNCRRSCSKGDTSVF